MVLATRPAIRKFLRSCFGLEVSRWPTPREVALRTVLATSGGRVTSGPFAGMFIDDSVISWGDGDLVPKLLGTYECECHDFLTSLPIKEVEQVINVGSAEGYYAVGMARAYQHAKVWAVDTDAVARQATYENARLNNVADRVTIVKSAEDLPVSELRKKPSVWIVDVEGAELKVLEEYGFENLQEAFLLVELHPFVFPNVEDRLARALSRSHSIEVIEQGPRNPHGISALSKLPESARWAAVSEGRPEAMRWLVARPRLT